jgi:hypothetical protein
MKSINVKSGGILCRGIILAIILSSGSLYSFTVINPEKQASHPGEHSNKVIGWIYNAINRGEGHNFAEATESSRATVSYERPEEIVSPTSNYKYAVNFVPDYNFQASTEEISVNVTPVYQNEALNTLASYLPAEMLSSVTEEKAQQIIDKAAALPASTLERLKQNPELAFKAVNMELAATTIK